MQKRHRILVLCVLLLLAAVALSIMTGSYSISPSDLLTTLLNKGSRTHTFAIFQIRLPRIVLAILVGSALGVSGTILQGIKMCIRDRYHAMLRPCMTGAFFYFRKEDDDEII